LSCASASEPTISDEECAKLRDHSIELSLAAADLPTPVRDAHRDQIRAAVADSQEARCSELTRGELMCSLAARSLDDLSACAGGSR
jgi:hypothetical protein